jgi:hypothetical protein
MSMAATLSLNECAAVMRPEIDTNGEPGRAVGQ